MSGDIRSAFITLALSLPAIVLCLSIHETAHGGAAYLLGDRTARDSGRVTLSPMAHIDRSVSCACCCSASAGRVRCRSISPISGTDAGAWR
ncbi:hypothetical protein [Butyricicoccus sp. OF10-2]|uniref:hypothetical protein n=1 Tax=Butyricicoccus sp. OF10-2 TaxID=2292298 RepID=UPI000E5D1468|nr:hypothetical protein [Butyricicoccus sp. OF10-2]RHV82926.1 hypothetical protein DXB00_08955 [Butyricicoccus sp. OF10-2]